MRQTISCFVIRGGSFLAPQTPEHKIQYVQNLLQFTLIMEHSITLVLPDTPRRKGCTTHISVVPLPSHQIEGKILRWDLGIQPKIHARSTATLAATSPNRQSNEIICILRYTKRSPNPVYQKVGNCDGTFPFSNIEI